MLMPKLVPKGNSYVKIPCSKRAAMRILLEVVQRGSRNWISGTVTADKALAFAQKMNELYATGANQAQRSYAKSKGLANTTLIMYPDDSELIRFWLLVSPGSGVINDREKLQDSHNKRSLLLWGNQYQLEHMQRPRTHAGGRGWTWALSQERYAALEAAMQQHASRPGGHPERRDNLISLVQSLMRMPGFYGIRQQQIALLGLGRVTWSRSHAADDRYPWPDKVPYLDKGFFCYHRPEPLRLDVLVQLLGMRNEQKLDQMKKMSDAMDSEFIELAESLESV
jgi:hypothetical protein